MKHFSIYVLSAASLIVLFCGWFTLRLDHPTFVPGPPPRALAFPKIHTGKDDGWDNGTLTAIGTVSSGGVQTAPWPKSATQIKINGGGLPSLLHHSLTSTGHWQIIFRWHGKGMPPLDQMLPTNEDFAVLSGNNNTDTDSSGSVGNCSGRYSRSRWDHCRNNELEAPLRYDEDGYYVCFTTGEWSGSIAQHSRLHSWRGSITTAFTYDRPRPSL